MNDFAATLKRWRAARRFSQLALATEAEISARHLAFLETARARPSRGMVLRLAEVLDVPRADRNNLLAAAGFAPHYPALPLDADAMRTVRAAMDWTVTRHAPYPALTMDRHWRIVTMNAPAVRLFAPVGLAPGASLLDAATAPGVGTQMIENWPDVARHLLARLRLESARAGGDPVLDAGIRRLSRDPAIGGHPALPLPATPVIPTIYRIGATRLSLFSTFAQFGTAEEVALADMQIELMFPADAATDAALHAMAAAAG
jgi:transcriptional regulator with XRE-family HTH domain